MKYFAKTVTCLAGTLMIIVSCMPFKPKARVSPAGELPKTFSLYSEKSEPINRWWEEFNDAELDTLIERAISGNFTLREAWSRLNQARALAVQVGAALYPDLTGTAGASYARERTQNGSAITEFGDNYSLGIVSSYELDLWGRIRSEHESALLETSAVREDVNAAAMTLAAEVANRWISIISQKLQKQLLQRQLKNNLLYLELTELRFRNAMVSVLDVYQQKQIVESVRAEIPLVEAQEQLLRHELAVLLGKPPLTFLSITREDLPMPTELPATGLPADLLSARPDLRAAGMRLKAADWQAGEPSAGNQPDRPGPLRRLGYGCPFRQLADQPGRQFNRADIRRQQTGGRGGPHQGGGG